MSLRRTLALFRRVALEVIRDRPSLALLFVAPVVITGLLTFVIREGSTPRVDLVVANEAGIPGSLVLGSLETSLASAGGSARTVTDEQAARAAIEDGSASVALVLPADLASGGGVTVVTKGLDPVGEGTQLGVVQRALTTAMAALSGRSMPTITHVTIHGAVDDDPVARFAPALVGFFAYFFVYLLTGVSFLRERTGGTLERLMATPVTRAEIVAGYSAGFGMFAMIQVGILMLWALGTLAIPAIGPIPALSVGLGISIAGSALIAYLVVLLVAVGAVSLGILVSTFARTELQIIEAIPIVLVPQFLLSGVLFPQSTLPSVLQPLTAIMPLSYAVNGLRQVFVAGADLSTWALQVDLLALLGFALLFAVLAALTIRREVA
ncbi:MAG: ABC transporter permease [Chloroflexota bacterium]